MFDTREIEKSDTATSKGEELVAGLRACHRQIGQLQARFYRQLVAVADAVAEAVPEVGHEYAADEVAAALTWTRRRAEAELNFAWELADLPAVGDAFAAGEIDLAKAKTIVYGLTGVDSEVAAAVSGKILERAERQTTGQIRARLRRLLLEANPEAAADRYQAGLKERKVVLDANDDGTANLHLYNVAPDQAALAFDRIDSYARAQGTEDEPRTLDQLRSDVGLDLLVGCLQHQSRSRRPIVDIRVELTTLMEMDENPGEVPGFGPVVADIARQVSEQQHSEWRFYVIDGDQIVSNGTTRRRPSRPQRRRIETRYPHCVFPGCRNPSTHADLDHRQRWTDGGPTTDHNLNPLCDHNHGSKDNGGWRLELIDEVTFEWTSPLGIKHLVEIEPP